MSSSDALVKQDIRHFYDVTSPFWRDLWGVHVHHGYWRNGNEPKNLAQQQLTEELATRAGIRPGARILDVGCGMGGSSIYLASHSQAETVGITLSPVQASLATAAAREAGANSSFLVMDGENAHFSRPFDVVWSIEAVSHFRSPENFFALASRSLKSAGTLALMDWFQAEDLSPHRDHIYIAPIKRAMLVPSMTTLSSYLRFAALHGFEILSAEDISENVAKTWELGLNIVAQPAVWKAALLHGKLFVQFLKSFDLMRRAFANGSFRYAVLIARKL
jgi:tocopherol O-methyltransferase